MPCGPSSIIYEVKPASDVPVMFGVVDVPPPNELPGLLGFAELPNRPPVRAILVCIAPPKPLNGLADVPVVSDGLPPNTPPSLDVLGREVSPKTEEVDFEAKREFPWMLEGALGKLEPFGEFCVVVDGKREVPPNVLVGTPAGEALVKRTLPVGF